LIEPEHIVGIQVNDVVGLDLGQVPDHGLSNYIRRVGPLQIFQDYPNTCLDLGQKVAFGWPVFYN
ncbi:hypothetical protein, partial [Candidatus Hakubella thermalkaliphila]|uniref:hypothetical protein n=1 Tax=Candidatus Hakubella thermalkaliphila TaxID=2754717 RepID=UPI001C615210